VRRRNLGVVIRGIWKLNDKLRREKDGHELRLIMEGRGADIGNSGGEVTQVRFLEVGVISQGVGLTRVDEFQFGIRSAFREEPSNSLYPV